MRAVAILMAAIAAWCACPMAATSRLRPRLAHASGVAPSRQPGSRPPHRRLARSPRSVGELPLAIELIAVCIDAGLPPHEAIDVVGRSLPGELGAVFRSAARSLFLGAPVAHMWSPSLERWPELRRVSEAMSHAERQGAELGSALVSIAADQRRAVRSARTRGARRVGVLAAAPLGFCFLPAFVLLSVVPLVAGFLQQLPAF